MKLHQFMVWVTEEDRVIMEAQHLLWRPLWWENLNVEEEEEEKEEVHTDVLNGY